ncbi:hypothetical protein D3C81_2182200 [compost metagenome]
MNVFGSFSWAIRRQSLISMLRKKARMIAIPKLAIKEEKEPSTPTIYLKKATIHFERILVASVK